MALSVRLSCFYEIQGHRIQNFLGQMGQILHQKFSENLIHYFEKNSGIGLNSEYYNILRNDPVALYAAIILINSDFMF